MLIHAISEFFGSGLLLSAISISGKAIWIIAAFSAAILLTGPISGGHINPIVTLWAYLVGKVDGTQAVHNVIGQVAAAVAVVYLF